MKNWRKKPGVMDRLVRLNRECNQRRRKKIIELLGSKCVRCGFSDTRALQVDHIDGGGNKHRKEKHNTVNKSIMDGIKAGEKKYQLLCANCNWIKRIENKECPQPSVLP